MTIDDGVCAPRGRVVVADAAVATRLELCQVLQQQGFWPIPVSCTLEVFSASAASGVDAVLADIDLPPEGGLELCRRVRTTEATSVLPVLLLAPRLDPSMLDLVTDLGPTDVLLKPVSTLEALMRVRTAVQTSRLRRTVAEHLARLQGLESMRDDLTSMIVHDMRSPLMGVALELDDLGSGRCGELTEAQDLAVRNCREAADLLMCLVDGILDVGTLESCRVPLCLDTCDLGELVLAAIESFIRPGEVAIAVNTPPEPVTVRCDELLVGRVVANLVVNALRYSSRGGAVGVNVIGGGDRARVEVVDDGPGVAPEDRSRIFDKFGQTRLRRAGGRRGKGLGLPFCRLAVEAHGGAIGVTGGGAGGSTFWFSLPVGGPSRMTCDRRAEVAGG